MTAHQPRLRAVAGVLGVSALLSGCGGGAAPAAVLQVSCPDALLGLDQLSTPGFQVQDQPHRLSPGSVTVSAQSQPVAAAEVRYFRPLRDLATSNGPIDVTATALCYRDPGTASTAFHVTVAARDRAPGGMPVSAGPLGDEAHADIRRATTASGTPLAQITVTWRLSAVVNTLTVRGREGAFGLGDVLTLAGRQEEDELAITTPSVAPASGTGGPPPAATPTPPRPGTSPSPSPG